MITCTLKTNRFNFPVGEKHIIIEDIEEKVFLNGNIVKETSLKEIRERLK